MDALRQRLAHRGSLLLHGIAIVCCTHPVAVANHATSRHGLLVRTALHVHAKRWLLSGKMQM